MKRPMILTATVFLMTLTAAADPWLGDAQTVAADPDNQYEPVVAYNSVHDEYLVVWTSGWPAVDEISGIRVDSQGVPIGSSFPISGSANAQWDPAVAYDPVHDRYLVIWTFDYSGDGDDTDILGRFIPWDGPSAGEPVFVIDEALSVQGSPAVAFNLDYLDFVIVWDDREESGPFSILGRRLTADGASLSPAIAIADGPLDNYNPSIAWSGELGGSYLIVYEQTNAGTGTDVYGTLMAYDGSFFPSAVGIAGWPGAEWDPEVAACRGDFLVVWVARVGAEENDDTEAYARAVSIGGTVGTIVTNLPGDFTNERDPAVSCNESGREYLVSWQATFTDSTNNGVIGAFLELDADPQGGDISIYAPSVGNDLDHQSPGLAFGADGRALVVWDSDRPPDGSIIDINGRFVGNRLFADGFESGDAVYWLDLDP